MNLPRLADISRKLFRSLLLSVSSLVAFESRVIATGKQLKTRKCPVEFMVRISSCVEGGEDSGTEAISKRFSMILKKIFLRHLHLWLKRVFEGVSEFSGIIFVSICGCCQVFVSEAEGNLICKYTLEEMRH